MTRFALLRKPSAFLPVAMSGAAVATLLVHLALFGVTRQADEGAAARLWQLLMVLQLPIIAYFAIRYAAENPKQGVPVLVLQLGAALVAVAPIVLLGF